MTPASPPAPRPYRRLRVPAFQPVPTRTRRDGWTIERQADFLGMLAETGSVIGACEAVGISRKSAYRLRARPGAMALRPLGPFAQGAAQDLPLRMATAHRPERGDRSGEGEAVSGLVAVRRFGCPTAWQRSLLVAKSFAHKA